MDERKILVIEDDTDINNLLSIILKKAGFETMQAFSGTEARLRLSMETPDMALLDLMLPGISGEALIEHIRNERQLQMPIIVISAKNALENKVETMTAGADDYITKPFEPEEVIVRVQAALRRYDSGRSTAGISGIDAGSENSTGIYTHKHLAINDESRTVTVLGDEISLTNYEYDILRLLISHPQKVYSRESIYEQIWKNGYYGEDNTVNVHISNIRKKIADKDPDGEYIKTVWGIGFKMA